jgi:hypothetical protein
MVQSPQTARRTLIFHSVSAWVTSSSAIGTQSPIIPVHKWTEQGPKLFASPRVSNVLRMLGKLGVGFSNWRFQCCPIFLCPVVNPQLDFPITPSSIVVRPSKKCGDGHAKNKRKNSSAHVDPPSSAVKLRASVLFHSMHFCSICGARCKHEVAPLPRPHSVD